MNSANTLSKFFLYLVVLLSMATPAYAIDTTTKAASNSAKKELVQEKKDVRKDFLTERADAIANLKTQMATREAALKLKLKAFKDQNKAVVAERVSTNLNTLNTKATDQMSDNLTRLSAILTKLEDKVNAGSASVKDPTAAKASIANAKIAITTAQDAVTAQSKNDYTLTLTTETKAKADATAMREKLFSDLKTTRTSVKAARLAVVNSIRVARGLSLTTEEGTASGH